jgi:Leucine-rich repeat (LRR) protein
MSDNKPSANVFTDIEQNTGHTFSIEDDDECEIEDSDDDDYDDDDEPRDSSAGRNAIDAILGDEEDGADDYNRGDQLPSVEEVKASNAYLPTALLLAKNHRRKIYLAVGAAAIFAMVISIAVSIGVSLKTNKSSDPNSAFLAQKQDRIDKVFQFLEAKNISPIITLRDPRQPEYRAAEFVAVGDSEDLFAKLDETNPITFQRFAERYILAVVYYATNGDGWADRLNFLVGDHCLWHTVRHTPMGQFLKGVQCDDEGRVVDLDLSNNNLAGYSLPDEIGFLRGLKKLHIFGNDVGGPIPRLQGLKELESLGLMEQRLVGTIPDWLGTMTKLTTLALGQNKLKGTIPASIANLENLRILGLEGLGLKGRVDPVLNLGNLQALYLEDNHLTGEIYRNSWNSMKELDISNNMIDGRVPENLFSNIDLYVVDIHGNLFFGDFPKIVANQNVQYVAMQDNSLSGTISDRIGFLNNLKHLDVGMNDFTGTLPDTIQLLTNLVSFSSTGNNFSKSKLDFEMFKPLMKLQDLSMKANQLTGTLPDEFAFLSNLRMLDLDANHLQGTIPTWFGIMKNLAVLQLNRNQLSGTIPAELKNIMPLQILLLDSNNLTGNADHFCKTDQRLAHFITDCYPGANGLKPEVDCRCCTLCCNDENPNCNNKDWTANYDPKAKYGYIRPAYEFSLDEAKEGWQKQSREDALAPGATFPPGFGDDRR